MDDSQIQQHMEAEQAAEAAPVVETQESAVETQPSEPVAAAEPVSEERKQPDMVPLAVHLRQREKAERELAALRQQMEVGNQRLQQMWERLNPEPQAPSKDDDVLGYTTHKLDKIEQTVEQQARQFQEERQRREQEAYLANVTNWVKRDEAAFSKANPDYEEVVAHAKAVKRNEYIAVGLSEQEADARLAADVVAIAMSAAQRGVSAAEMAYNLGRALGYQPKPKQEATNVVKMRQDGAKMAAGGGAGVKSGVPSFAELAAMTPDEFAEATKGKNWQKLAG